MYELIEHQEVGAGGASSIEFTSIPATYTDLLLVISGRADSAYSSPDDMANDLVFVFNGDTATNYSARRLAGDGSSVSSTTFNTSPANDELNRAYTNGSGATANAFGSTQLYIPNYTSTSAYKSISIESVNEHNATKAYMNILAGQWASLSALNSIKIYHLISGNFVQYSSATLYGVGRKAGIGRQPLASGGYTSFVDGYWVHTFTANGSFKPFVDLDVEYLVVAGGGAGGFGHAAEGGGVAGGGGAGGYRSSVSGEMSGGGATAESGLSLTANTNYSVAVGAGGAASSSTSVNGGSGSNSSFSTVTSTGGGGGGSFAPSVRNGLSGGSGGGGATYAGSGVGGAGTANQGYAGGNGVEALVATGGGGGAAEAGASGASSQGGNGGNGIPSSITGSVVYRAGGGGGNVRSGTQGVGGAGGGGDAVYGGAAGDGEAFTGSGGGGRGNSSSGSSGAGGSGIVIVRYRA